MTGQGLWHPGQVLQCGIKDDYEAHEQEQFHRVKPPPLWLRRIGVSGPALAHTPLPSLVDLALDW